MQKLNQALAEQRVVVAHTHLAPSQIESFEVELNPNKQTITSHLNLAPETFSRVLARFSKLGFIEIHGRTIQVANAEQIRLHAC